MFDFRHFSGACSAGPKGQLSRRLASVPPAPAQAKAGPDPDQKSNSGVGGPSRFGHRIRNDLLIRQAPADVLPTGPGHQTRKRYSSSRAGRASEARRVTVPGLGQWRPGPGMAAAATAGTAWPGYPARASANQVVPILCTNVTCQTDCAIYAYIGTIAQYIQYVQYVQYFDTILPVIILFAQ